MTSLLTSRHIRFRHICWVCWHYKSVCSLLINFYEWVKYPTTTNCAKDQCPPNSPDLTQPTRLPCVVCVMFQALHKLQLKLKTIPELKSALHRSVMTCHRQRSTKLSMTFAKVWTRVFRPIVDIEHMMSTGWSRLIWHNFVKVADNCIKICSLP